MANDKKQIKYLSEAYPGSTHDYAILKAKLPPGGKGWFDGHPVWVDLGFLGIEKDYAPQNLGIPFKKSKNNPLTAEEKELNKCISSFRVSVEHSIGGFKRYRFCLIDYGVEIIGLYNMVASVCAGLWNFCLTN